jgi:hypothetical protein
MIPASITSAIHMQAQLTPFLLTQHKMQACSRLLYNCTGLHDRTSSALAAHM